MYQLTPTALTILRENIEIRRKVAMTMGIGEAAIWMDINRKINRNGRSVAQSYDGLNKLLDLTGLTVHAAREIAPERTPRKNAKK